MRVCIGITTKNRKNILVKAIDSALNQNYLNMEVFVVDDGSTDGTYNLRHKFPKVRWKRFEKSQGLLKARNYLMENCDADIFISLDDDAWFMNNDEVQLAVQYFKNNDKLGAIAFDILEKDSERAKIISRCKPFATNIFIGAGHALRLTAAREVGFYIPFPLNYGHEEKDLAIRLLNLGYVILFLPGVHVWHDASLISRNVMEQSMGFAVNDLIFKYRRVPLLFLPPVLVKGIYRTLRGKVRNDISGFEAVKLFFKLLPYERERVKRVKNQVYLKYRRLSKPCYLYIENTIKE